MNGVRPCTCGEVSACQLLYPQIGDKVERLVSLYLVNNGDKSVGSCYINYRNVDKLVEYVDKVVDNL
jgi:hypothetical protein